MLRPHQIPVFHGGLDLQVMSDQLAYLVGERDSFALRGELAVTVAGLIDGQRTVEQIVMCGGDSGHDVHTLQALDELSAQGLITPLEAGRPRHEQAFWQSLTGPGARLKRAPETRVALQSVGGLSTAALRSALEGAGVSCDDAAADLVVVTDDYLHPALASVRDERRRVGGRWLPVKAGGAVPWIGPVLGETSGPCWECLRHWLRTNQPIHEIIRRDRKLDAYTGGSLASVPASLGVASHLAALGIAGLLAAEAESHPLQGQLLELELPTLEIHWHSVVKRPQCSECGDPLRMRATGSAPIRLQPTPRPHREDGGYRNVHPRVTYDKYKHLISRVTGAVTHVSPMPERDTPLRAVYTSGYRVTPRGARRRQMDFRRPCAGKGKSIEQARASALCEALERYSGVYQGDEASERGSWAGLAPRAVHPNLLQHFSRSQQLHAGDQNHDVAPHRWVARPFDETLVLDWTSAWSLTYDQARLVPLAYCYSETPVGPELDYCRHNANGAAAGNGLEEAILQGLLELVERDAAAIWWYNRLIRPGFELETLADPYFRNLQRDYARLGWKIWALDLTHDLGIPTSVAVAQHAETQRFCIGFGCHLSPLLAVQRALTELNQLFAPADRNSTLGDLERLSTLDFLHPNPHLPLTQARDTSRDETGDLKLDLEGCVQRFAELGLEVCVVNKTRPDIGLSVVQVIVPRLRHFWPRFAPGRLYDVPVRLGWLDRPNDETELNPVPLFL
jgi:oxazoline/thiazoline synthase